MSVHFWIVCVSELLVLFCMFFPPATSSKYRWIKNRKKKTKKNYESYKGENQKNTQVWLEKVWKGYRSTTVIYSRSWKLVQRPSLHDEENLTADQKYPLFIIKAHNKAASKTLPERKPKQGSKVSWQDDSVVTARNQLNGVRKQYNESVSEQDKKLLESAKRNLDSTYERVEEGYIMEKVTAIQSASQNMQSGLA